jgi:hypothetical protein
MPVPQTREAFNFRENGHFKQFRHLNFREIRLLDILTSDKLVI